MLSKIKIILKPEEPVNMSINMSSVMHGVLMELIGQETAEKLHTESLRPYSQYLEIADDQMIWYVCSLNEFAHEKIIKVLLDESIKAIYLKKHKVKFDIVSKELKNLPVKELSAGFYRENSDRYVKLRFLTPTAFKQSGKYTFYPDLSCIYGSLMRRMDFVSLRSGMYDDDLLEELTRRSEIVGYNLRTVNYHLEGVRIPAFIGWITIKVTGAQSLINYVNMLMRFGEFSGVGIKTSLGMGALKIMEGSKKKSSDLIQKKEMNEND